MPKMKLLTGRRFPTVVAMMLTVITLLLGVGAWMGWSPAYQMTLVGAITSTFGGLVILYEALGEGRRRMLSKKGLDYSDFIVAGVGAFALMLGLAGTYSALVGETLVAFPAGTKTLVYFVMSGAMLKELFTE